MKKQTKKFEILSNTTRVWIIAVRQGKSDLGEGTYTPKGSLSLAEEIAVLRKQNKELFRANGKLQEENEFLEEAGDFFAASCRKSAKKRD